MLSDPYGQGVQYPSLDDKPNARTLAENLVTGIVPKSVMQFDSRSQRGATLTSPVAGMQSWIRDIKLMELYDGAYWVPMAAGTNNWTTITLNSPWTQTDATNNAQGPFQYKVVNLFGDPTIMLRGGIGHGTSWGSLDSNYLLNSTPLPTAARPGGRRTVLVACSDVASSRINLKLDINIDGTLRLYGIQSDSKPPWVSFNGVFTAL